jgi:hypothetical protein
MRRLESLSAWWTVTGRYVAVLVIVAALFVWAISGDGPRAYTGYPSLGP